MRLGICASLDMAPLAAESGFDYMETSVGDAIKPREDEAVFQAVLAGWRRSPLPLRALNIFIPGDLRLCGDDRPTQALHAWVRTVMRRAREAGVEKIVFGSGAARRVPEGFDPRAAWDQLIEFGRFCAGEAAMSDLVVVVEPLRRQDCNIIVDVREGARMVREVDHPNLRLLVDSYHWGVDGDTPESIAACAGLFAHAHAATWPNRRMPGTEPSDFAGFFRALRAAGYRDGDVSVEAICDDPRKEYPAAVAALREAWRTAARDADAPA